MERPKSLPQKHLPVGLFTVKYSSKDFSQPQFLTDVTAIWRDPKTKEFVIENIFEEVRLPGDMDTEIVVGGD